MTARASTLCSVAVGAATGSRSMTGLAAVALTADRNSDHPIERALAHPAVRVVLAAAAGAELVIDKLPATPSRLEPRGLTIRVVVAAGCGAVLGQRTGSSTAGGALAAAGSALANSLAGSRWRRWSSARLGRDWPGAVLEDLAAVTLAATATR